MSFSFGGTPGIGATATTTAQSTGFSFGGGQTTTAAPSGGFSFGTPAATQQPAAAPAAAATTAPKPTGLGTPNTGFSFGGTPGGGGLNLTQTPKPAAAPTAGNITFGTPSAMGFNATTPLATNTATPAATAAGTAGFSLGGLLGSNTTTTTQSSTNPAAGFGTTAQPSATGGTTGGFALGGGFGAKTAAPPTATPQAPSGFQLGQKLTTVATTAPAAVVAPTLSLGGNTTTTQSGLTLGQTATTTAQATGFKLGGVSTSTAAATTAAAGFGSLGAAAKTTGALVIGGLATGGLATGGLGVGIQPSATTTSGASLTTATSTSASTAAPATMNYRQLEENINKWTLELEEQEKIFLEQATQVNAWDRLLIDNGDKITQLNTSVEHVKLDQQRLDQELDFILSQQRELEELIVPLEQAVESLPPLAYQQHADLEREHTYKLAENIDAQLKTMSRDLKEIIEHLNTSNTNQDTADPVIQISKILNAHMDSLNWVDQNAAFLQRRVEEVAKQTETQRKQQDRSSRHIYD